MEQSEANLRRNLFLKSGNISLLGVFQEMSPKRGGRLPFWRLDIGILRKFLFMAILQGRGLDELRLNVFEGYY